MSPYKKKPALGEHPKDLDEDKENDTDGNNGITAAGGATTPGATDASASQISTSSTSNLQASSSAATAAVARRLHATHHGGPSATSSGAHQFAQRRPVSAAFDGNGGGLAAAAAAAAAGGAARSSSARVKVDRGAAAGGGGGSGRVLRPGGGAPARRTRPPGRAAAAHDGMMDVADNSNAFSFGPGSAFDAVGGGGGDDGDGSKNRSCSSALRVAGGGGGSEGEAAANVMPATAKSGAFRVPRGGVSETMTRVPAAASGDALHQRSPAARVVARRSSVVPAVGGEGEPQSFGASGALGGVSKVGRGVQPARVVGRQQQQRLDASAVGRREDETGEGKADGEGAMRAVVAAPVALDRRHVLRQVTRQAARPELLYNTRNGPIFHRVTLGAMVYGMQTGRSVVVQAGQPISLTTSDSTKNKQPLLSLKHYPFLRRLVHFVLSSPRSPYCPLPFSVSGF